MTKRKFINHDHSLNSSISIGFTIIELLVIIVIVGILAAITMMSYSGITQKARAAALQSDLRNAATQLEISKLNNGDIYPATQEAASLKSSSGITLSYSYNATNNSYCLTGSDSSQHYLVSSLSGRIPLPGECNSFVVAWGGSGADYGRGVVQTNDGGYVMTGYINSFGAGGHDTLLAKYASDGSLSWNKLLGGASDDSGSAVIQTSDGGYATFGHTVSFGAGVHDALLAKYTSDGALSWNKTWGGTGEEYGASFKQTADGGYIVTGYTTSFGAGSEDMYIAKFASDGTLSWNKTWGGTGYEYGRSVIQTADGGYIVTGYTKSFGVGNGYNDVFVVKYTSDGTLSWNKTWGGTGDDYGYGIVQNGDGSYVLAANTNSYGAGGMDIALLKYSSDGTLLWNKTMGGSGGDYNYSLIKTSDGGYATTGNTDGFSLGSSGVLLVKYNSDGAVSWAETWGGAGAENSITLAQTNDGGYIVAGYTNSYGAGGYDVALLKYNFDGSITNCSSTCTSPSLSVNNPSATESTPSVAPTVPSSTITSPSTVLTSPSAATTTLVAP